MKWVSGEFISRDAVRIFYRFFPNIGARHTVLVIHGFGEHSGRYEKFPERMPGLAAQWAVMDLRGMGSSGGMRGDARSFEDYLDDVDAFMDHLQQKHEGPGKYILLGHSLGGLIASLFALKRPARIKTLVLSVPFLRFRSQEMLRLANACVLRLNPRFVYRNPVIPTTLSHDPSEIDSYRKDPLIIREISARLVEELMRRMTALQAMPAVSFPFPVAFLVAGAERVVAPRAALKFFQRLAAPRKEWFRFDGFYHEIFNESEQQKAFNVLKTIIEDCV